MQPMNRKGAFISRIYVFILSSFLGMASMPSSGAASLFDKHTEGDWTFFIRSAKLVPLPIQAELVQAPFSSPHLVWSEDESLQILSIELAILYKGQPYAVKDPSQIHFDLKDRKGTPMHLLSAEQGAGAFELPAVKESSDAPPDLLSNNVYFQLSHQALDDFSLQVDIAEPGIHSAFELPVPKDMIQVVSRAAQERTPVEEDIIILSPAPGMPVCPGDEVSLNIEFSDHVARPDKILILSPFYSFEDAYANGHYALRIEKHAPLGAYDVLIIAVWDSRHLQTTASKLLPLKVINNRKKNPAPRMCPLLREI